MSEEGYNGWANYETWLCQLWMDNDEESHKTYLAIAQDVWEDSRPGKFDWQTREQQANYNLGNAYKNLFEDEKPSAEGFFVDLIDAGLSSVKWFDIADHWLELVDKGVKCGASR